MVRSSPSVFNPRSLLRTLAIPVLALFLALALGAILMFLFGDDPLLSLIHISEPTRPY